jgi:ABC-2 type transport system ATP-binding protein
MPAMAAPPAIAARGLEKRYGAVTALAGVDLEVAPGEVFALLGPNGAGKTTLVEILEGFRRPGAGEARVLGEDPARGGPAWRARIGVVFQSAGFFDVLTVREVVAHFASFYPAPLDPARVIAMVGLEGQERRRLKHLSGGQKRRVDLALGIVGDPELIFLDEPTTGLDPEGRRQLWAVIRQFAALGKTVLLTTHYLEEAEALADRVAIIIRGRFAAEGTPAAIGGREEGRATVTFHLAGRLAEAPLPPLPGLERLPDGRVALATAAPTQAVAGLARWASALGEPELPGLEIRRPTLEDVYLRLVRAHDAEAAAAAALPAGGSA